MRQYLGMLVLSGAIGVIAGGCGSGSAGPAGEVKVTGSVTKDGKGLDGVNVGFDAADPKQAKGTLTDANGKFATTLKPGSYTVILSRMVDRKGNVPPSAPGDAPALQDKARTAASLHE